MASNQPNSTSTTATTRKQSVVDELNRRNSVVSAASVSSNPFLESEGLPIKQTNLDNKPPTSDFISYGNNRKNVSSALDETQNGMKGIPSVTGSRYIKLYDIGKIRLYFDYSYQVIQLSSLFHKFNLTSMENDNAELYGGEYDNYYENGGWYQDEYGEWCQDPNYAGLANGSIPNNKSTISNHNVIQTGSTGSTTTSANNKSMQNTANNPAHREK